MPQTKNKEKQKKNAFTTKPIKLNIKFNFFITNTFVQQ